MKTSSHILIGMLFLFMSYSYAITQDNVTVVAATSEAAEGLDLHAVAELFKECNNLEEFEKALNDPDTGINNLDIDNDGNVDFIRVVEEVERHSHLIILQVPLGENEFQDVATIEVEKDDSDAYYCQVRGNELIYGPDYYYVVPAHVQVHTWPVIVWIYRPVYHPYRSVFLFGHWPQWWHPFRPVPIHVYHTRTVKYDHRSTFSHSTTSRVTSVRRVQYVPHHSTMVKKQTIVVHKTSEPEHRRVNRPEGVVMHKTPETKEVKKVHKRDNGVMRKSGQSESRKNEKNLEGTVRKKTENSEGRKTSSKTVVKKTTVRKREK